MKKLLVLLLISSLMLTSGCWDSREIEQRLFVTAIAVDINEEVQEGNVNRLIVTYKYPNINTIGKNSDGGHINFTLSVPASGISQASTAFMGEAPFPFYFKHLKVIIFSKELLEHEELVRHILDELNRSPQINKRARIAVTEGKARDVLKVTAGQEYRTEGGIYQVLRSNKFTNRFTVKSLTDLITDFDVAGVTIVPRISIVSGKFVVSGGCILKNYKFLAWVDQNHNRAINIMNGIIGLENIDTIYNGTLLSYAVTRGYSRKKVTFDDGITVRFDIKLQGYLQGYNISQKNQVYDEKTLEDIENNIEEELEKKILETRKFLDEIGAPLFGVGEHMSKFHPKMWKQVKDNWQEMMPEVKFQLNIDVNIRRTGLTK